MRWSPMAASRGGYTGRDPTSMPSRTMHGANILAIAGSRLYTVIPKQTHSETIGFVQPEDGTRSLQYPIWTTPLSVHTVRTLLTHPELMESSPDTTAVDGVTEVFRSRIENNGGYRNLGRAIPV